MIPDTIPEQVRTAVLKLEFPLLFATVSGAHLYGFPSADSDWDLRGAHILPAEQVMGLFPLRETIEIAEDSGVELDLVTHDVRKFFSLLLRPNGYVLEQLYSPIVVFTTPEHEELKRIARGCVTRLHVHHYLGFAANQWRLYQKDSPRRIKPLLYVFRVLLTGIHLMRTGDIEANLNILNETFRLPFLPELIARKTSGIEKQALSLEEHGFYDAQFEEWERALKIAGEETALRAETSAREALSDLLVQLRLKRLVSHKKVEAQGA
jgi:predicted nucleotidyltransferase